MTHEAQNHRETIARYILEIRAEGLMLPYKDYEIIDQWLRLANHDGDRLLLVLSEILVDSASQQSGSSKFRRLSSLNKRVTQSLRDLKQRDV